MPTTTNKQRVLTQLFALKKRYEAAEPESRPVLEQFLYAVCREAISRAQADRAFRTLQERFFDWNEIRVSSPREVEEALGNIPEAENRAGRLISFLQEVFETTFSFDLESLHKKGLKQAAKQLSRYQAANDYAVSWVIQHSLGGHAIPLDAPSIHVLRRLGLIDGSAADLETLRTSIEHLIPKSRGPLFIELISAMAQDPSWEEHFDCLPRSHASGCPDSQENGTMASATERVNRPKPR